MGPLRTRQPAKASVARAPSPAIAGGDGQVVQAAMRQNRTVDMHLRSTPTQTHVPPTIPLQRPKTADHWNRCPRRGARRNRSAIVRRKDRPRRRGSGAGCWSRTGSRRQRRGPRAVSTPLELTCPRAARDGAVRTIASLTAEDRERRCRSLAILCAPPCPLW